MNKTLTFLVLAKGKRLMRSLFPVRDGLALARLDLTAMDDNSDNQ